MKNIRVLYESRLLVVCKEVADELKLKNNQPVSTELFWLIIQKNAAVVSSNHEISKIQNRVMKIQYL